MICLRCSLKIGNHQGRWLWF